MRLWHYKLIQFLPKSQLIAQWRELNSIFRKQDKHILINYVYEYPKNNLMYYTLLVLQELTNRHYQIKSYKNYYEFFKDAMPFPKDNPFPKHHTDRYLLQCFYNLQEKYDRGQKDFSKEQYDRLLAFVSSYSYPYELVTPHMVSTISKIDLLSKIQDEIKETLKPYLNDIGYVIKKDYKTIDIKIGINDSILDNEAEVDE